MRLLHFLALTAASCLCAYAQTTVLTYQGRLADSSGPASGLHDFEFRLFNAALNGTQHGPTVTTNDLAVTNGLFTATLDFGANFPGEDRFLQIAVRPGASTGAYTPLSPRQRITAAPYALTASRAQTVEGGAIRNPGYIGTTSTAPLDFSVNNQRALRLEYATGTNGISPNLIGGYSDNVVSDGFIGAVIGGGGAANGVNSVGGDYATVVGGLGNTASGYTSTAMGQRTTASATASTAMGQRTTASGESSATMGDRTKASGFASVAMGNYTTASGNASTASGVISTASGFASTASGDRSIAMGDSATAMGQLTTASGNVSTAMGSRTTASNFASTAMGYLTTASGFASTAMGDSTTASGDVSVAMGKQAQAIHQGAFVWADRSGTAFTSTGSNQFLIRATGGVAIGTNDPAGAALRVAGTIKADALQVDQFLGLQPYSLAYLYFAETAPKGVAAGQNVISGPNSRNFNTNIVNSHNLPVALIDNNIQLPAGTYQCRISAPAYRVDEHQTRLNDLTANRILLYGTSEYSDNALSPGVQSRSVIVGQFTLAVTSTIQVQHNTKTVKTVNGLGIPANPAWNDGNPVEVYTIAEFWKIQ